MCSDGIDRHRQAWMSSGCDESSFKQETHVSVCPAGEDHRKRQGLDRSPDIVNKPVEKLSHSDGKLSFSGLIDICFHVNECLGDFDVFVVIRRETQKFQTLI